jgi:hypothetical protein
MITLLLILIAGFLKITADTIRVPETMQDSWFKKYTGHWWVDPQVGWINHKLEGLNVIFYPFVSCFGDLWHTLYTLFIACYIAGILLFNLPDFINWVWFAGIAFISHGMGVFIGEEIWRGHH